MLPNFDEVREQTRQVHKTILEIASKETISVGFRSSRLVEEAFSELQRFKFKKPWLASKREWTRRAIIFEPQVYEFLWHRVELEFIVDGGIRFFSGIGKPRRNPDLAHIEAHLPEVYWSIDLNNHFEKFSELFKSFKL
jgi:hypothetical protein